MQYQHFQYNQNTDILINCPSIKEPCKFTMQQHCIPANVAFLEAILCNVPVNLIIPRVQ